MLKKSQRRYCFAPGCKTGYSNHNMYSDEKISLFSIPKEKVKEWSALIPGAYKQLTSEDALCEKHFCKEYVKREVITETYAYPLKIPRLTENAKPSIWPDYAGYLLKNKTKRKPIEPHQQAPPQEQKNDDKKTDSGSGVNKGKKNETVDEVDKKKKAHTYCCVFGCRTTDITPQTQLYRFPALYHKKEQKLKWIAAVKETNGSCWEPVASSRICSSHFIGNKKSEHPFNPSFIPTIFRPKRRRGSKHNLTERSTQASPATTERLEPNLGEASIIVDKISQNTVPLRTLDNLNGNILEEHHHSNGLPVAELSCDASTSTSEGSNENISRHFLDTGEWGYFETGEE